MKIWTETFCKLAQTNGPILAKKDHVTASFCHSSLNISLAWTILQKLILYHKTCALSSARPRSHDWGCFLLPQQGYTATSSSLQFTITEFMFEIEIDTIRHHIAKLQMNRFIEKSYQYRFIILKYVTSFLFRARFLTPSILFGQVAIDTIY